LSHASGHRFFNRDSCVVNSCNVKKMPFGKICPILWPVIGLIFKDITGNTGKVMRQKAFRLIGGVQINHEFG